MKKIYEDDFVIAVDTESDDTSIPIVVMYSTKVVRTAFEHCLKDFNHDERFVEMVMTIIQTGRKNGIYKNKIADCRKFIERWKEAIDEDSNDIVDKILERRTARYENEIDILEMYDSWDLKEIRSIYLGGLK